MVPVVLMGQECRTSTFPRCWFSLPATFEKRLRAGEAVLMQPECRQMESDTCVCRMVFVVTL